MSRSISFASANHFAVRPAFARRALLLTLFVTAVFLPRLAGAASSTWLATPTDANWPTTTNWLSGVVPGALIPGASNNPNQDTATFNAALAQGPGGPGTTIGGADNPIIIENTREVKFFLFDTTAGAYVFNGALATDQLYLASTSGTQGAFSPGSITMNAAVTSPETFNIPILLRLRSSTNGGFSFVNNSTTTSATLSFFGTITNSSANTRPQTLTLDGTNTGSNTIAAISDSTTGVAGASGAIVLIKNGTGTWVLAGANDFPQKTSAGVAASATINAGTLEVQNAASLGAITLPVINAGTLKIDNVTLNQNALALNNGGTIRMNGSGTVNGVTLATAAGTSETLATTNATDVMTVGNAANKLTVGAATSLLHVAGPGTVLLSSSTTYAGTWSLDAGNTQLGDPMALGPSTSAAVAFGSGSTGVLQLNGTSPTLIGLNTNATPGSTAVENGPIGTGTLTVNNATANTFAGVLRDGGTAGVNSLALVKIGAGTLSLGSANTYSGGTMINGGTVRVTSSTGTGTGLVTVNSTGTLARVGVGPINVGGLTINTGSALTFEFNNTPANTQIIVSPAATLTINGGGVNLYNEGTLSGITPAGNTGTVTTYQLIQFSNPIGGTGLDSTWTTASPTNPHVLNPQTGFSYSFTAPGDGFVDLTMVQLTTIGVWKDADGNWSAPGSWTGGVPTVAGDSAHFTGPMTASHLVTLDANETVGGIQLNNNSFKYTIADGGAGGPHLLTLDNKGNGASITDFGGSHEISASLSLAEATTVMVTNAADSLKLSGPVHGVGSLAMSGNGTLVLTSTASDYAGGTLLNGGTINFSALSNLGGGALTFNGGTLQYAAGNTDDISTRTVTLNANGGTIDTNGNLPITLANAIGNGGVGGLTKAGAGTLILAANATYTGPTNVNVGTLQVGNGGAAGAVGSGDVTIAGGAVLDFNLSADNAVANNIGGAMGAVVKDGGNTLTLSGNNTWGTAAGGALTINAGTVKLGAATALPSGVALTTAGTGTLDLNAFSSMLGSISGTSGTITDNSNAGGTTTLTVNVATNMTYSGMITGAAAGQLLGLTKNGAAMLSLTGTDTLTGPTFNNAGTLEFPAGGVASTAAITSSNTATLLVDGGSLTSSALTTIGNNAIGGTFSLTSGSATFNGGIRGSNGDGSLIQVTGGTFTATSVALGRSANIGAPNGTTFIPPAIPTTSGFYVNGVGAIVNIGTLTIGTANSTATARIDLGAVTASGEVLIGNQANTRWNYLQVNGGTFTSTDATNGIVLGQNNGTNTDNAELYLTGGTTTAERIGFGTATDTVGGTANLVVNGGTLFVGSGGLVQANAAGLVSNVVLTTGTIGAKADWATSLAVILNGAAATPFTIQTADAANVPHNITLSGSLTGAGAFAQTGGGVLTLSAANFYTGGTIVNSGTLRTTVDGALGSGPLAINSTGGATVVNVGGNESIGSLSGTVSGGGSASVNVAAGKTFALNQASGSATFGGTVVLAPGASPAMGGTLTSSGGTEILTSAPQLGNNSVLGVNAGTLQLNVTSGSASVGAGVTANVSGSGTLELAGSISALGTTTVANRTNITNTSSAAAGVLVSGGNQQVGGIDGTGNVQVNGGTSLTANHITAGALVIGGDALNPAVVTIDASDPSGLPLAQSSGFALAGALTPSAPFGSGTTSSSNLLAAGGSSTSGSALSGGPVGGVSLGESAAAVPEPSGVLLLGLGSLVCLLPNLRRKNGRL